jgi:hypothetical protein
LLTATPIQLPWETSECKKSSECDEGTSQEPLSDTERTLLDTRIQVFNIPKAGSIPCKLADIYQESIIFHSCANAGEPPTASKNGKISNKMLDVLQDVPTLLKNNSIRQLAVYLHNQWVISVVCDQCLDLHEQWWRQTTTVMSNP